MSADFFTLDPQYERYQAGLSKFKFSTIFDAEGDVPLSRSIGMTIFMVLCISFITIVLLWYGSSEIDFAKESMATVASVISCKDRLGGLYGSAVNIRYRFEGIDKNGQRSTYLRHSLVKDEDLRCKQLPPGTRFSVQYIPGKPASVRIDDPTVDQRSDSAGTANFLIVGFLGFSYLMIISHIVGFSGQYRRAKPKFPRLQASTIILSGEMTSCKPDIRYRSGHHIIVEYQVQSPSGATLAGRQKRHRQDLHGQPIPPPGTPVRVLYADDDVYVML